MVVLGKQDAAAPYDGHGNNHHKMLVRGDLAHKDQRFPRKTEQMRFHGHVTFVSSPTCFWFYPSFVPLFLVVSESIVHDSQIFKMLCVVYLRILVYLVMHDYGQVSLEYFLLSRHSSCPGG